MCPLPLALNPPPPTTLFFFLLKVGLGLDRLACPAGLDTMLNGEKKARVRNVIYAGDRVRKMRLSYLDTPGMQVVLRFFFLLSFLAFGTHRWQNSMLNRCLRECEGIP